MMEELIDQGKQRGTVKVRQELLQGLAGGENIDEIARRLDMSRTNAAYHLERLKKWNRCTTTFQIIALAVASNYVTFKRVTNDHTEHQPV